MEYIDSISHLVAEIIYTIDTIGNTNDTIHDDKLFLFILTKLANIDLEFPLSNEKRNETIIYVINKIAEEYLKNI